MNNQLLVALGFFGLGAWATFLTLRRAKCRDMSTSGVLITPESKPGLYRLELASRLLGCLFFYGVATLGLVKYLNQK